MRGGFCHKGTETRRNSGVTVVSLASLDSSVLIRENPRLLFAFAFRRVSVVMTLFLPDSAGGVTDHGHVGLAAERILELRHISNHSVHPELTRRMRIDPGQHAGVLGTLVLTPDLSPPDKQALLGHEAIDRLLWS